jgi:hypothetical protein
MRARGLGILILCLAALGACQIPSKKQPATPAPLPCELAGFGDAPGQVLVRPKRKHDGDHPDAIPLNLAIAGTGAWVDADPGWRAWRYWLRFETAASVAVRLQPFELPGGAQFWLCSPDRTTRQGPITGKGLGDVGQYRSPEVPGPELWLEVLAPVGSESEVTLVLAEAFAAAR